MYYYNKKLRDFILTYNKIVDHCFTSCVFSFNGRELVEDEVINSSLTRIKELEYGRLYCFFLKKSKCIENCSHRFLASQTRLSRNFADGQVKKMNDAVQAQQQPPPPNTAP